MTQDKCGAQRYEIAKVKCQLPKGHTGPHKSGWEIAHEQKQQVKLGEQLG